MEKLILPGKLPLRNRWLGRAALAGICAFTIWIYVLIARDIPSEFGAAGPAKAYYNLLVDGFRAGQLNLKQEVPPGLRRLADPYDPETNGPYRGAVYRAGRMHDMSYYRGQLYLYFGVTPALVLFWPAVGLTGHYISHAQAVVIFAALGFVISVGLFYAVWRRYFPQVSVVVVCAGVLALGFATSSSLVLRRPDLWEVPISCGYAMVMLTLAALWGAWHQPVRRGWWLALASLAYGLGIGARPSLLLGAVILLGPVIQTWRSSNAAGWRRWRDTAWMTVAALGPIGALGCGLLVYNYLRFGNPFEFGQSYQLSNDQQGNIRHFSLGYLWFNFRVYFLAPASWNRFFPYLRSVAHPPRPEGQGGIEHAYGVLTNTPFVWLALAAPLAWWRQTREQRVALRGFVISVAVLFGISALLMGLFYGACLRYQMEFVPALVLLAVLGLLGVESTLADRSLWRMAARWGWGAMLLYSVAFSLLYGCIIRTDQQLIHGRILLMSGETRAAIAKFQAALDLRPDYDELHLALAAAFCREGRFQVAQEQFNQALRFAATAKVAMYYSIYGMALTKAGRTDEAIAQFQAGLARVPDSAELHDNLGNAYAAQRREQEARSQFEAALRLDQAHAAAHCDLGILLAQEGRLDEAIGHLRQALRTDPKMFIAHFDLGLALLARGFRQEAISHYEEALRLNPNFEPARKALQQLGQPVPPAR